MSYTLEDSRHSCVYDLAFPYSSFSLFPKIKPTQYIQAHTVLKSVVQKYADQAVLVLGGARDNVRKVAERCSSPVTNLHIVYSPQIAMAS